MICKDLDLLRYLVVISKQTMDAIDKQVKPRERFPHVNVIDAIGLVFFIRVEPTDDL